MTSICLVRHGETAWNSEGRLQGREDVPLNDRGRDQARKLADALAVDRWDLLVSSPLCRAWETATIMAARLGLPEPVAIPELMERDYGAASGLTKVEAARRFPDGVYPASETRADVRGRCWPVLERLATRSAGGSALVVTHGSVIKSLLLAISDGAIPAADLRNACSNLIYRTADSPWQIIHHDRTV
ncbi:histidine phosphatase family protein [Kribbella sp. NBC_01245]